MYSKCQWLLGVKRISTGVVTVRFEARRLLRQNDVWQRDRASKLGTGQTDKLSDVDAVRRNSSDGEGYI